MGQMMQPKERLSIVDVATELNQSHKTLQRWDKSGILPAQINVYGNREYNKEDVAYMKRALNAPTRKDVAKQLNVSEATVRFWERTGALVPAYEIGRTVYYDEDELHCFIKRRGEQK